MIVKLPHWRIFMKTILYYLPLLIILLITANIYPQTWIIGPNNSDSVIATLEDGTLTISGNGPMMDWTSTFKTPWRPVSESIIMTVGILF